MRTSKQPRLLKNGTLLLHTLNGDITPTRSDLLITNGRIARIATEISSSEIPKETQTLDCTGRLISPGLISTHYHLWQTPLKGRHADHTLLEYFPTGNFAGSFFTPHDVFWSQLAGALEAIDAGTTTVVDHSSINYSAENVHAAVAATVSSGIRSTYCYCPTPRPERWAPFKLDFNFFPDWVMSTFSSLAASQSIGSGRVSLGFAFDGIYLPQNVLEPILKTVYDSKVSVVTTHDSQGPSFSSDKSIYYAWKAKNILPPRVSAAGSRKSGTNNTKFLISHGNFWPTTSAELHSELSSNNTTISITPSTELSMGMSSPASVIPSVPIALADPHLSPLCSLGIDCHTFTSASLPAQARELLMATRAAKHAQTYASGQWSRGMKESDGWPSARQAFNLMTLGGAKAIGMENEIGTLKEGHRADVVVWDADSPRMLAASMQDPAAAIVMHSSIADVLGVIVDGEIRKWNGKLESVNIDDDVDKGKFPFECIASAEQSNQEQAQGTTSVKWETIAARIKDIRSALDERMKDIDYRATEEDIINAFHMNRAAMV